MDAACMIAERIVLKAIVSIDFKLELTHVFAHLKCSYVFAQIVPIFAFINVSSYLGIGALSLL